MTLDLNYFLSSLDGELAPIRELALRLASTGCEASSDGIALSNRPNLGPKAYALRLYAPLPPDTIAAFQNSQGITIPNKYFSILSKLNGAHAFQFSLFGIPPSMASPPPLLNRSVAQPYDIASANRHWIREYDIAENWFHFGGGPLTQEENIGYFIDEAGAIHAARKTGELMRSWTSFSDFLEDELQSCEARYPAYEVLVSEMSSKN